MLYTLPVPFVIGPVVYSFPAPPPGRRRTLRMQTDERQASLPAALQEIALPRRLERLAELACNLWWTWNPSAQGVFKHIDPSLWDDTYHNPVKFLRQAPRKTLNAAVHNKAVLELYDHTLAAFDASMHPPATWFSRTHPDQPDHLIAYFSTEFGLHDSFPIYAGGLGILSGDHAKEASDLGLPFVGVGFLYEEGYFHQRIMHEGKQEAYYNTLHMSHAPVLPVYNEQGAEVLIDVDLPGRRVYARIWKIQVGRIPLYLMDTDIPHNNAGDRKLTARLYGGDQETRISQEILLGIGGGRAPARPG